MNYKTFLSTPDLTNGLLQELEIIVMGEIILRINNTPDHTISNYQREIETDYYFSNSWDFNGHFIYLLNVSFENVQVYDYDTLHRIAKEKKIYFDEDDGTSLLLQIHKDDPESFCQDGMGIDFDCFKLKHIRTRNIDNINKQLGYEGSFNGNNTSYDTLGFEIYSLCNYIAVPFEIEYDGFYKSLIAESYILFKQKNFKLAFFIAFSAIESFVYECDSLLTNNKGRINEKFNELFAFKFSNLKQHQIYTSIINDFSGFEEKRNKIAHGKNNTSVTEADVLSLLNFIAIIVTAYNRSINTFKDLHDVLSNKNHN